MSIFGIGTETYLYINGLHVEKEICIDENKTLMPSKQNLSPKTVSSIVKADIDYAIVVLCSKSISAQLKITAKSPKELAGLAWNAQWDLILLSAALNCNAVCNLQCTHPIESIKDDSILQITNYHMQGFWKSYAMTEDDCHWVQKYFPCGLSLMERESFRTAAHALATYGWHSMPRVQLAVIWAGIESLFEVDSEVTFRISLYIAKLLSDNNSEEAKDIFSKIKALYKARSSAVHGGNIKGDAKSLVNESSIILNKLLRKCMMLNSMPNIEELPFD